MAGLGWQELLIVLVIIMVIFGAGKLPQVARSLGQGIKEFKAEANASEPAAVSADGAGSDERSRVVETREMRPEQV